MSAEAIQEIIELLGHLGLGAVLGGIFGYFLLRSYLPAYFSEKAKNLATKEDVAAITTEVEGVRAEFAKESVLLEKRREVYERITDGLRVFISGHEATESQKNAFHSAYSACWLWAPDEILQNLNRFIRMQQEITADPDAHSQEDLKRVYGSIILAMRQDAGFPETSMAEGEYSFVRF